MRFPTARTALALSTWYAKLTTIPAAPDTALAVEVPVAGSRVYIVIGDDALAVTSSMSKKKNWLRVWSKGKTRVDSPYSFPSYAFTGPVARIDDVIAPLAASIVRQVRSDAIVEVKRA